MVNLVKHDLEFILKQIKIAEAHANGGDLADLVGNPLAPYGLRTVDGSFNNLIPGREEWGASDSPFPPMTTYGTPRNDLDGDEMNFGPVGMGAPPPLTNTDYGAPGSVADADPRLISNLIVDQTMDNPAVIIAALEHAEYAGDVDAAIAYLQGGYNQYKQSAAALAGDEAGLALARAAWHSDIEAYGIEMDDTTVILPNVSPDIGDSAPYSSVFTLFGQFFDHGLDHVAKGNNGTVYMPLSPDDPLYVEGAHTNFMAMSRASTGDDAMNTTTPWVDQNQTYGSHASVQVFLREYKPLPENTFDEEGNEISGWPMATGRLLQGEMGGMSTWADVKKQAADVLGIKLTDLDVGSVPLIVTDEYGNFIPGANGYPQLVTGLGVDGLLGTEDDVLVEGNPDAAVDPTAVGAFRTPQAFLLDIAHNAVPVVNADGELVQDPASLIIVDGGETLAEVAGNAVATDNRGNMTEYDNELLDEHFIAGDGRANENVGLTTIHHVFHSEHNLVVEHAKETIIASGDVAFLNEWLVTDVTSIPDATDAGYAAWVDGLVWDGTRLFQAGRFTTEMEYQHLVFEEFARKMQPDVDAFLFEPDPDINPAIFAEFANVVYRFGHSMLRETIDRVNTDGTTDHLDLFEGFLNPLAYDYDGTVTHDMAAGAIMRGLSGQVGNEIDEFVTNVLRNQLVGIPLDLTAINIARGRDTNMPSLNEARAQFRAAAGGDSQLNPYTSWADFALNLKNPASIVNFIAAYGTHALITNEDSIAGKRAAAMALVFGTDQPFHDGIDNVDKTIDASSVTDRLDFLNGTGTWNAANSGLDSVDLWMGGLAEKKMDFGGMLGSTFSAVFELQMENLQDGDRFYYLSRVQGLNLLSELEGNSLAKMVLRNTDLGEDGTAIPGDIFSRPDLALYIDEARQVAMTGLADPVHQNATLEAISNMVDRRDTDGDGVIDYMRYNGGDHAVMQGSDGNDTLIGGEGDDSLWGGEGDDRLDGGYGVDHVHGGAGDDIITNSGTDIGAMDFLHGEEGDDVIHGGAGLTLIFGNQGQDFLIAGPDGKTVMGGIDNDFILGGDGMDFLLGEAGDDWMEGGGRFDTLAGENSELFFNSTIIGHDVLNGSNGDVDYDAESGDDIMVQGVGIQRNNGMAGFDWAIHKGNTEAANSDLGIGIFQNQEAFILRDRFDLVEGLSGWKHNDILTGRSVAQGARDEIIGSASIPAPDDPFYSWSNALTEEGVRRIDGLRELLSHLEWDENDLEAVAMVTGDASDILLGGDGNDTFEGKGGDDIIDGDAWLNVRISVRDANGVEIATTDGLTSLLYKTAEGLQAQDASDLYLIDGETVTLENAMLDRAIKPAQLHIVREILHADGSDDTDTAIFAGNRDWYEITHVGDRVHVARREDELIDPRIDEGTDVLINIERIQFSDQVYTIRETGNVGPTGRLIIQGLPAIEDQPLTVSAAEIVDENNPGGTVADITYRWQVERNDGTGDYEDVDGVFGNTFTPGDEHVGLRIRVIGSYIDAGGVPETVFSVPTDGVVNVPDEPTGPLLISDMTPTEGQELTATVAFTDPDGMTDAFEELLMTYQWQYLDGTGWQNVLAEDGGNNRSFTPGEALVGKALRIQVTYEDDATNSHTVTSEVTAVVGNHIVSTGTVNGITGDGQGGMNEGDNFVQGSTGIDTVTGLGGNDVINGGGDADTLDGGAGDDTLTGGHGDDEVKGGDGNDTIVYGTGDDNDTIDGGAGSDTLRIVGTSPLSSDTARVELVGGTLTGVGGATVEGVENVDLDLGGGNDTLDYNGTAEAVTADLLTGTATGFSFVRGVENVIGGSAGDTLLGNNAANELDGAGGNDTLRAGFGNDTLEGSAGDDLLYGEQGDDILSGGDGNDRLDGGAGEDTASYAGAVTGVTVTLENPGVQQDTVGAGLDTLVGIENLTGSSNADDLTGDAGANIIDGGGGADLMAGGAGDDTYVVENAGDLVTEAADEGNDTVRSSLAAYTLADNVESLVLETGALNGTGNSGDNRLTGNSGNNTLDGGAGIDTVVLTGTIADHTFALSGGNVTVTSVGGGTDTLVGIEKVEIGGVEYGIVAGTNGADAPLGGTDADEIVLGFNGVDTLEAGAGDDILVGGNAADAMRGGLGNDTYVVNNTSDDVDELGGDGEDTVISTVSRNLNSTAQVTGDVENLTLIGTADINGTGNALDNVLTGNAGNNMLAGGGGLDTLIGSAGNDILNGGAGDDTLEGGEGNDTLNGQGGVDTAVYAGSAGDYSFGFAGADLTSVTHLESGDVDTLSGIERLQFVDGQVLQIVSGDGDLSSTEAAIIVGGGGNDTIVGSNGNDVIIGGQGNDTLNGHDVGDADDDTVELQLDDDTFIWNAANGGDGLDTINGGGEGVNGDTFQIVGNDEAETYRIYTYDEAVARIAYAGSDEVEILVTREGADGVETPIAELTEIEEIVVNGGAGGGAVEMYGNFETTTSLRPNTITIVGSEGDDMVDISSLLSAHRIVFRTKGGNDTIVGTLRPQDVVELEDGKTIDDYDLVTNEDGSTTISSPTHSVTFYAAGTDLPHFGHPGDDEGEDDDDPVTPPVDDDHQDDDDGVTPPDDDDDDEDDDDDDDDDDEDEDDDDDDDDVDVPADPVDQLPGTASGGPKVGTSGTDVLVGDGGDDSITGLDGDDVLVGYAGKDIILGGNGHDVIFGWDGKDIIWGGSGNDTAFGGSGNDMLDGEDGDDRLFGDDGRDMLTGGAGDDTVVGGEGDDWLTARNGDGNDVYFGDEIDGGSAASGTDTLDMSTITANAQIDLGTGLGGLGSAKSVQTGTDTLWSIENVITGSGNDTIKASASVNVMDGGSGSDTFVFGSAAHANGDTIVGFETGDKIDLSSIDANGAASGNQHFALLINGTITTPAQVAVTHETIDGQDFTVVSGNTAGDDNAEFKIRIEGTHDLTASNFLL